MIPTWLRSASLATLCGLVLTACFGGGGGEPGVGGGIGQEGPTTLKIWRTFDSSEVFQPIITQFEENNPNVKLEYAQLPLDEYELVVSEALAGGQGPDIWSIRNDWIPRHKDKLVPMPNGQLLGSDEGNKTNEDKLKELFVPIVAQDVIADGSIYGLPLYMDTLAIYRNQNLIDDRIEELRDEGNHDDAEFLRNPFNTWDDLQRAVTLLTKRKGADIQVSGLAAGTANNIERAEDVVAAMMLQNKTEMVSPEHTNASFHLGVKNQIGQTIFPGTNALTQFTSYADPDSGHYSWNAGMPNDVQAFIDGKVAMIFGLQYYEILLAQVAPTLQFETQALPQVRDADTPVDYPVYWVETVTKNADNPELAWDVVEILAMEQGSDFRSATGRPDPRVVDLPPTTVNRPLGGDPFDFQGQTATNWFKTRRPDKVDGIFNDLIQRVGTKSQAPQNAIEEAAQRVSAILQSSQP